jgi:hypothetical protein
MAYNFLACDRDQAFLLPPDLRDWLPADHLAWFVLDVVDQLDLGCEDDTRRDTAGGWEATHNRSVAGSRPASPTEQVK